MATTSQSAFKGINVKLYSSGIFSRDGYELTKWGTDTNGGTLYVPGSNYAFNANTNLFAQWDYIPIRITYGINVNSTVYKFSSSATLAVVNSAGSVLSPYAQAGVISDIINIRKCVDAGPGCVTAVADYGFYSCWGLTQFTAPECKTVGAFAFSWCNCLESISLPKCETIGDKAFNNCIQLSYANFPKCVSIGTSAFACYAVGSDMTASFPACTTIGESAFYQCGIVNAEFPKCSTVNVGVFLRATKLATASFPECTSVKTNAFAGCTGLKTIYFPKLTVKTTHFDSCPLETATVGNETFGNQFYINRSTLKILNLSLCSKINALADHTALTTVSAPVCTSLGCNSDTSTGAFEGCTALVSINLPECIAMESWTFKDCTALKNVYLPKCSSVGGTPFVGCNALESVVFGMAGTSPWLTSAKATLKYLSLPNITTIQTYSSFAALKSISAPACTNINGYGFYNCSNLETVYMPACASISRSSAAFNAFWSCYNLKDVTLGLTGLYSIVFSGASVAKLSLPACTKLFSNALANQTTLSQITASALTSTSQSALYGCTALKAVSFPLCTHFGGNTLTNCSAITTVSLPVLSSIGQYAFQGCTGLTDVVLPKASSCGLLCFGGCTNLRMISMPELDRFGGASVFSGCTNLKSIYIGPSTASSNISTVFAGLSGYTIYVPSAKLTKYQGSAGWSEYSSSMAGY